MLSQCLGTSSDGNSLQSHFLSLTSVLAQWQRIWGGGVLNNYIHGSLWCSGVKPQSLTAGNESSAHEGKETVVQPQPPVHCVGASQSPQECGFSLTLALHLQQPGSLVSHPALGLHLSAKLLSEKFGEDHFAF